MAGKTYETIHINIDIMSSVGWMGERLSEYEIEKLKEKLEENLKNLVYDTVLEFEDEWGDNGLDDFTAQIDIEHKEEY